jgi:hypothetical protein
MVLMPEARDWIRSAWHGWWSEAIQHDEVSQRCGAIGTLSAGCLPQIAYVMSIAFIFFCSYRRYYRANGDKSIEWIHI